MLFLSVLATANKTQYKEMFISITKKLTIYQRKQDVYLVTCQKRTNTHLGTVKGLHLTN